MKTVWLALGAAMVFAQPSLAANPARSQRSPQEGANTAQPSPSQIPAATTQQDNMAEGSISVKQQLKENLIRSGFTNVTVMPGSFVIHANDPQGNPMSMFVSPESFSAFEVEPGSNRMNSGRSVGEREPKFLSGAVWDATKADLTDTPVETSDNGNAGTIKGIVMGQNGELSYLVTTANGHDVAINPDVMVLSYDENAKTWNAMVEATLKQIQAAPQAQVE